MTIYTYVTIAGSAYNEHLGGTINRATDAYNSSSDIKLNFPNPYGRYANKFSIGQDINVYIKQGIVPDPLSDPLFFGGYVEDKEFAGPSDAPSEKLVISGRSYISVLYDATVSPISYANTEISAIVIDLVAREAPTISTAGIVSTGVTLVSYRVSQISLYDAIKQLAELADCYFYVSPLKVLTFAKLLTTDSTLSLQAGVNIAKCTVTESRKPMFNKVYVYGDNLMVDAGRKTFTANGGSVYTLDYRPSNTSVFVGGSTASKQGGVLNMTVQADPGSGTQYLVDYANKQIVFVSGTNAGNNIPVSGTDTILVDYQRQRQIITYAQDDASVETYKPKTYVLIDKNIKSPSSARVNALSLLDDNAHPFKQIDVEYIGWADIVPGTYAGCYEPYYEVSGAQFNIARVQYEITPENMMKEDVLKLTLNRKMVDGGDIIKQALLDIKRLRAQEIVDDQIYTRIQFSTGSEGIRSSWSVATRGLGSSFVLGNPVLGKLGEVSEPLQTGMVSYYKFDGNTNDEKGAHNATASGATSDPNGFFNQAYVYDGANDYMDTNQDVGISAFTVAGWFKLDSTSVAWNGIMSNNGVGGSANGFFFANYYGGNWQVQTRIAGVSANTILISPVTLGSTWHHIALSYDNGLWRTYLDGTNNASGTRTLTNANDYTLRLGNYYVGDTVNAWNGKIDEVGIWSRALSGTEISSLYNGGSGWVYTTGTAVQPYLGDSRGNLVVQYSGADT